VLVVAQLAPLKSIPEKLNLPAGKYEVKFAVRDNLSGRSE
jgi:hypothetical protein